MNQNTFEKQSQKKSNPFSIENKIFSQNEKNKIKKNESITEFYNYNPFSQQILNPFYNLNNMINQNDTQYSSKDKNSSQKKIFK